MPTTVQWVSPLEGTEFEPEVVHLLTFPAAVDHESEAWAQLLAVTDPAVTANPHAVTLLVIRYDQRFGLLGTCYSERDRHPVLDAMNRMADEDSWDNRWAAFYEAVDIRSTQAGYQTLTELVHQLKALGHQTATASVAS